MFSAHFVTYFCARRLELVFERYLRYMENRVGAK